MYLGGNLIVYIIKVTGYFTGYKVDKLGKSGVCRPLVTTKNNRNIEKADVLLYINFIMSYIESQSDRRKCFVMLKF